MYNLIKFKKFRNAKITDLLFTIAHLVPIDTWQKIQNLCIDQF